MTKTHTKKHKRCTAPFPHSGGSWIHTDGKLEREATPQDAPVAAEAAQEGKSAGAVQSMVRDELAAGDSKRGRRFGN